MKDFAKYADVPSDEWLDGKVVSIMNYGAFVRLDGGVDGMVHISQMGAQGQRIDSVYNAVEVRGCGMSAVFLFFVDVVWGVYAHASSFWCS